MQRFEFKDRKELGMFISGSPKEGGRLNRSIINYHSGIPDIDEWLKKDNNLIDNKVEFGISIYNNAVVFMFYRGDEVLWSYVLSRESIVDIKIRNGQQLNIRKNSKVSGGVLGAIGSMGIVGGIFAGTIDALTTQKDIPKDQLVLGSVFEIILKTENPEPETIVVSTTDKYKDNIEAFLKKILEPKTEEKKGCYIATVCYGDITSPEVEKFREYRDNNLNRNSLGRAFIKFYYLVAPTISNYLEGKSKINRLIKIFFLDKIYNSIK